MIVSNAKSQIYCMDKLLFGFMIYLFVSQILDIQPRVFEESFAIYLHIFASICLRNIIALKKSGFYFVVSREQCLIYVLHFYRTFILISIR